jgi:hypothetical protein
LSETITLDHLVLQKKLTPEGGGDDSTAVVANIGAGIQVVGRGFADWIVRLDLKLGVEFW